MRPTSVGPTGESPPAAWSPHAQVEPPPLTCEVVPVRAGWEVAEQSRVLSPLPVFQTDRLALVAISVGAAIVWVWLWKLLLSLTVY